MRCFFIRRNHAVKNILFAVRIYFYSIDGTNPFYLGFMYRRFISFNHSNKIAVKTP